MMTNDRSDVALSERLELAEKATKGPWYHTLAAIVGTKESPEDNDATCICFTEWGCSGDPQANAAHIAANSPDVVRADIAEILRLRAENEHLNKEADWLVKTLGVQVKDSFGCVWCWLSESNMCNGDCTESLRNAARKAVEEERNG